MYPTIMIFNMTTGVGFHFLNSEGLKAFFPPSFFKNKCAIVF